MGKEREKQGCEEKDEPSRPEDKVKWPQGDLLENPRDEGRWDGLMGLEPENVKEPRSARGKWACVYLAENLSGLGFARGVGSC